MINLSRITSSGIRARFPSSGTMGEENNQNKGIDKLLLAALTAQMFALMDQKLEDYRAEACSKCISDLRSLPCKQTLDTPRFIPKLLEVSSQSTSYFSITIVGEHSGT
ncbi:hypothetical protein F2Q70_00011610 [Brassica cretica]|uniref:Uncharacterized protein n=1 Tax=Brassica cretica TaxID=69181 RepID=A0A8S9M7J4_BRACR|nr:hypothetical protein F2Q70_00011610 [Brassica cretica]